MYEYFKLATIELHFPKYKRFFKTVFYFLGLESCFLKPFNLGARKFYFLKYKKSFFKKRKFCFLKYKKCFFMRNKKCF